MMKNCLDEWGDRILLEYLRDQGVLCGAWILAEEIAERYELTREQLTDLRTYLRHGKNRTWSCNGVKVTKSRFVARGTQYYASIPTSYFVKRNASNSWP